MTVKEWAETQTGTVLKLPAGTVTGHDWWYLEEDGIWTTDPKPWRSGMTQEFRPRVTTADQYVEITLFASGLEEMTQKALTNRTG